MLFALAFEPFPPPLPIAPIYWTMIIQTSKPNNLPPQEPFTSSIA